MFRFVHVSIVSSLFAIGCGGATQVGQVGNGNTQDHGNSRASSQDGNESQAKSKEVERTEANGFYSLDAFSQPIKPAEIEVTIEDLDEYIGSKRDEWKWTRGERTPGELAGLWVSDDADRTPVFFTANGHYREGFNWRNGKGRMAVGHYAIAENGRVYAYSKAGDIQLGSHYRLDGKTLTGPKGPLPNVRWVRVGKAAQPAKTAPNLNSRW